MKTLEPITVNGYTVTLTVSQRAAGVLSFTATCGETTRSGAMTLHPNSARTAAQLQADMTAFAELLAEEAAGHEHNRVLLAAL